ncbi:MAG: hypothetical protein WBG04_06285 [Haloferula sp.]
MYETPSGFSHGDTLPLLPLLTLLTLLTLLPRPYRQSDHANRLA